MITFSFGRNWKRYVKYVANEEILASARGSLVEFFGQDFDFTDKVFVDIGCGSGIFSIAALELGCAHVISFDCDLQSIEATNMAKEKFIPDAKNWEIMQGDVLDGAFIASLQQSLHQLQKEVIVYSWGVLHHSGNLPLAIQKVQQVCASQYTPAGGGAITVI